MKENKIEEFRKNNCVDCIKRNDCNQEGIDIVICLINKLKELDEIK